MLFSVENKVCGLQNRWIGRLHIQYTYIRRNINRLRRYEKAYIQSYSLSSYFSLLRPYMKIEIKL